MPIGVGVERSQLDERPAPDVIARQLARIAQPLDRPARDAEITGSVDDGHAARAQRREPRIGVGQGEQRQLSHGQRRTMRPAR